eukprot:1159979-Pelagomonas_calceolata.AAC.2
MSHNCAHPSKPFRSHMHAFAPACIYTPWARPQAAEGEGVGVQPLLVCRQRGAGGQQGRQRCRLHKASWTTW